MIVRNYVDADAERWLRVLNSRRKNPLSLAEFRERERRRDPLDIPVRLVATEGAHLVALGQLTTSPYVPEGLLRMDLVLSPEVALEDAGRPLLAELESRTRAEGFVGLCCEEGEEATTSVDWLRRHGFEIAVRRRQSQIAPRDAADRAYALANLAEGIRLIDFEEAGIGWHKLLPFIGARLSETPDLAALPAWSDDRLVSIFRDSPAARSDWIVLGLHAEAPVGIGVMHRMSRDAYVYFIGVSPDHRGGNIATAILGRLVAKAAEAGCPLVHIDNRDDNLPALRLNDRIGFKPCATRLELRKTL